MPAIPTPPSAAPCWAKDEALAQLATLRYDCRMDALPLHVLTRSPEETRQLAASLAASLIPGTVLALHGDLGAGKTCFIQGLAEGLGVEGPVTSPTFTLVHEYAGRLPLYHADLYRIADAREALRAGLEDYLHGGGVCAVEWAERAPGLLPAHTVHVRLRAGAKEQERDIVISREGTA